MTDLILVAVIAVIVGGAIAYIRKEKKPINSILEQLKDASDFFLP